MKFKDLGYFIGRTVMFIVPIYIIYFVYSNRNNQTLNYLDGIVLIISAVYILLQEFLIVWKQQQEGKENVL